MKVIVAGTRTIDDYDLVADAIENSGWHVSEVVCGASEADVKLAQRRARRPNVDILGAIWGIANSVPVVYFPAQWRLYGDPAGPIRNRQMAEYADALVLVWDGTSRGSASMLRLARNHNLKIYERVIG